MAKILITGGAGYIGSHAVLTMVEAGHDIVVIDNLFRGYRQCIEALQAQFPSKITFYQVDLINKTEIDKVFEQEQAVEGVMHFAGLCLVNESMEQPHMYFANNVYSTVNLLESMTLYGVKNIVLSSTCNLYKVVGDGKVDENSDIDPLNAYGESKYLAEREVMWYEKQGELSTRWNKLVPEGA